MGYAFISYDTKNQNAADAMYQTLKDCGIDVWMAPDDLPIGTGYAEVINRAIKNCSCFILLLSTDAQNSIWVSKEVERALSYRKMIFPVQIESTVLNDAFKFYLANSQVRAVQKIDSGTAEINELLSAVRTLTDG